MDVVYAFDENYAPHAAVSIASLLAGCPEGVRVFVLSYALSPETAARLSAMGDITVIDTGDFAGRLKDILGAPLDAGRFSLATYIRIFAAGFLPRDIEKFLYLDSDTLVLRPIDELFKLDLGGCPLAMAPEPTIYKGLKEDLNIPEDEPYYNAGVMLVDRTLWEKDHVEEKCTEFLRKHFGKLRFHDQDILNSALRREIAPLPQRFNFFSNYYYRSYQSLIKKAPWYGTLETPASYASPPFIVHFAGLERPWYKGNFNPFKKEYEEYLALTPWQGRAPEGGHRIAMLFYHLMNLMTKVSPGLRDLIGENYYAGLK